MASSNTSKGYKFGSSKELKDAVNLWFSNNRMAVSRFGYMSDWNTAAVEDMSKLFQFRERFNEDLSNWDTSKVTIMYLTFNGCKAFKSDLSKWNTSRVTNMDCTFKGCRRFKSDLSNWDTSKVTNMRSIFENCNVFNSDLSNWDTSKVTSMSCAFADCNAFNSDLSNWDTSKVTSMSCAFSGCNAFNSDLSNWDTSKVTNMRFMFSDCKTFNSDLSNWNTSKVKDMRSMFFGCTAFNCDLSRWNMCSVKDRTNMLDGAIAFNDGKLPSSNKKVEYVYTFDNKKKRNQIAKNEVIPTLEEVENAHMLHEGKTEQTKETLNLHEAKTEQTKETLKAHTEEELVALQLKYEETLAQVRRLEKELKVERDKMAEFQVSSEGKISQMKMEFEAELAKKNEEIGSLNDETKERLAYELEKLRISKAEADHAWQEIRAAKQELSVIRSKAQRELDEKKEKVELDLNLIQSETFKLQKLKLETDDIMREKENMQRLKSELETKQTEILRKEVDIEFALESLKRDKDSLASKERMMEVRSTELQARSKEIQEIKSSVLRQQSEIEERRRQYELDLSSLQKQSQRKETEAKSNMSNGEMQVAHQSYNFLEDLIKPFNPQAFVKNDSLDITLLEEKIQQISFLEGKLEALRIEHEQFKEQSEQQMKISCFLQLGIKQRVAHTLISKGVETFEDFIELTEEEMREDLKLKSGDILHLKRISKKHKQMEPSVNLHFNGVKNVAFGGSIHSKLNKMNIVNMEDLDDSLSNDELD